MFLVKIYIYRKIHNSEIHTLSIIQTKRKIGKAKEKKNEKKKKNKTNKLPPKYKGL